MTNPQLEIETAERNGVCVIHVRGPVDHLQFHKLEEAIQVQLDRKQLRLIVDLAGLTYIVSAGINTMGHAASQYDKIKGRLCFVRPALLSQWEFFVLIGVDQILPWAASVDDAVRRVTSMR